MKICNKCKLEKTEAEFNRQSGRPGNLRCYCKVCCAHLNRVRYAANPEKTKLANRTWYANNLEKAKEKHRRWLEKNPLYDRAKSLRLNYGLSLEGYDKMFTEQEGKCKICFRIPPKKLFVDHCHTTGVIRGLLCHRCNTNMGGFEDSPELLRKAAAYLENSLDKTPE